MIITVTMNPAIDKTVEIVQMEAGGLNRIQRVEQDAGGKGINVSKTIQQLGGSTIATGFLGGNSGRMIQCVLEQYGILSDFIWVEGETRTNTKVLEQSGRVTELNEPGPEIRAEQTAQLLEKLKEYAQTCENPLFVLSGSIPKGVPTDIYGQIIRIVHEKGAKVLLDADGELFVKALEEGPDFIKPNRFEMEQYAQLNHAATQPVLLQIAKNMMKKRTRKMAISMGSDGALFIIGENSQYHCPGLKVKAHSTVGAGDAMVAAMAYAEDHQLKTEESIRLCMATSAGAVTTIGTKPPAREVVDQLMKEVIINQIGE